VSLDQKKLEAMPVHEYVDLMARPDPRPLTAMPVGARLVARSPRRRASATAATVDDYPRLKPGLWKSRRALRPGEGRPAGEGTMCLDDATAREMYRFSQG